MLKNIWWKYVISLWLHQAKKLVGSYFCCQYHHGTGIFRVCWRIYFYSYITNFALLLTFFTRSNVCLTDTCTYQAVGVYTKSKFQERRADTLLLVDFCNVSSVLVNLVCEFLKNDILLQPEGFSKTSFFKNSTDQIYSHTWYITKNHS